MLLIAFSSTAHAEKTIPLDDVVSAFTWLKVEPEFPIVLTSESEDQVSFRIFDDVYLITNKKRNYEIVKKTYVHELQVGEEVIHLDAMTIEKALKFSKAKARSEAALSADAFQSSQQSEKAPIGFQFSQTLYQCKSDLPSRIMKDGSVVNEILQHTWIQNGAFESFGMPNTDEAGYFGGLAHIRTPDSFIGKGPKHLECAPVLIPEGENEKTISDRIACVARRLSLSQNPVFESKASSQNWIAHFDYHALDRNCLMATRLVLECAGAQAPQVVNAGIGGKFDWNDFYSVSEFTESMKTQITAMQARLNDLRASARLEHFPEEAELLLGEALDLDAKVRGVTGEKSMKTLREICDLARINCLN